MEILLAYTVAACGCAAVASVLALTVRAISGLHRIRERPRRSGLGLKDALARIEELEAEVAAAARERLKAESVMIELINSHGEIVRECERWRHAAESKAERVGDDRSKYGKLRAVVIKTLHPDHAGGSGMERAAKGELFKAVWPEIERIDCG